MQEAVDNLLGQFLKNWELDIHRLSEYFTAHQFVVDRLGRRC
jgi:hypothetical protein